MGLDEAEAERRRGLYGENVLERKKRPSLVRRLLCQLKDPMLIILLGAAVVGLALAIADFSTEALFEPLLIIGIVAVNALLSALQERGAQRSLDALEDMGAATCRVRRDGKEFTADARTLVPFDYDTVIESVKKTGRIVIVTDACERGSFASEVARQITEMAFDELDAPPVVVASKNWITPAHELEEAFFPQPSWILDAIDAKIVPLKGHVRTTNQTLGNKLKNERKGV